MATREEIESWALSDYEEILGKEIFVAEFTGYFEETSLDFELAEPLKAKVAKTPRMDILHWNSGWLDPYWNLEVIEIPATMWARYPELEKLTSLWMFGDSYSLDGKYQPARYTPRKGPRDWSPRGSFERKRKR